MSTFLELVNALRIESAASGRALDSVFRTSYSIQGLLVSGNLADADFFCEMM